MSILKTTSGGVRVVAEAGCNHCGDLNIARQMISVAAWCGVDCVKFQKRNVKELLSEKEYNRPYDNFNSFGATYGEHRDALEFSMPEHYVLQEVCRLNNVGYGCSVWDMTSARQLTKLKPDLMKIPSAKNHDIAMMKWLLDHYDGPIHVSCGMMTLTERERFRALVDEWRDRIIVYHCTSAYPVEFKDVYLAEIDRFRQSWSHRAGLGFSGHHRGIAVDIAAATRGAQWIERHFTLDRTWKGTDHAASLEPDGLRRLVRDLRNVHEASGTKSKDILDCELPNRRKLKGEDSSPDTN